MNYYKLIQIKLSSTALEKNIKQLVHKHRQNRRLLSAKEIKIGSFEVERGY